MKYLKRPLTVDEQIELLIGRGLMIEDRQRALRWLGRVSYYRMSAYFLPFKDAGTDSFRSGTTFTAITRTYNFDRKLRLTLLDAISRLEIAIRTATTYEIGHAYGCSGYVDPRNFDPVIRTNRATGKTSSYLHSDFMASFKAEEQRANEDFVKHFRDKYNEEQHLPIWMATELMSLGTLSRLFQLSRPNIKRAIANRFLVSPSVLESWLHSGSVIRNICAHHGRLFGRSIRILPVLPRRWAYDNTCNEKIYGIAQLLHYCLSIIAPNSDWGLRLFQLLEHYGDLDIGLIGFPTDWSTRNPWSSYLSAAGASA